MNLVEVKTRALIGGWNDQSHPLIWTKTAEQVLTKANHQKTSKTDHKPVAAEVVIPSYTRAMKTAISVPDETFSRASKRAAELGMSRSEFFTEAAQQYLKHLDTAAVTSQIDHALALAGDDDSSSAAVQAGRHRLALDDEW